MRSPAFSGGGRVFLWGVVGTAEGAEAAVGKITGLDGGHLAGHTLSDFSGVQPVQRFGAMQGGRFLDSTPHRCIPPRPARGRLLLRNFIAVSCSLNSARGAVGLLEMTGVVGLIFALGAFHIGGESSRKRRPRRSLGTGIHDAKDATRSASMPVSQPS